MRSGRHSVDSSVRPPCGRMLEGRWGRGAAALCHRHAFRVSPRRRFSILDTARVHQGKWSFFARRTSPARRRCRRVGRRMTSIAKTTRRGGRSTEERRKMLRALDPSLEGAGVWLVVPCYRVKAHILDVIAKAPPWIGGIVCVDDACPEQTGDFI